MPVFSEPPPTPPGVPAALRFAAERDIPEVLIAHQDDPDLVRALGQSRPPSGAELGRRIETDAAVRAAVDGLWLTITEADADECIGQLETVELDADAARTGLIIWIAPHDRGRGLGAAALSLAGRWLIAGCGLQRVQLLAPPANRALAGAAARAGFRTEGVLRGHTPGPTGRDDVAVYSLVAADLG